MTQTPMTRPGEIAGWPKLVVTYTTEPAGVAALLPPGLEPLDPVVTVGFYCVPVLDEPEYGVSVKVAASWRGVAGQYNVGLGIDQEAAVHVSGETNGQPKFLCDITYFRFGDRVTARASHQGYTFVEYTGTVTGEAGPDDGDPDGNGDREVVEHEWWTKYSRAIGGAPGQYDFPPHVVDVATTFEPRHAEDVDGDLVLRDSPWDPDRPVPPDLRAGPGPARHPAAEGAGHHQRRTARPRRVLAVRRRHRRQPVARPPWRADAVMTTTTARWEHACHGRDH